MIHPAPRFPSMHQPHCLWCDSFPCVCRSGEDCACGGRVVLAGQTLQDAMRAHQRTAQHGAWREVNGL